jgi:polyphosphate glucokinase
MTLRARALGIDIGGSGMKGAVVDVHSGALTTDRFRIDTPQPATPDAMASVVADLVNEAKWSGPVGCTFPGVVRQGIIGSAVNLHESWNDVDADALFSAACSNEVTILNDADAAGLAEIRFGSQRARQGVVLLLTFGTGIGSALFLDGRLLPNTELGHVEIDGCDAEPSTSAAAKVRDGLDWEQWAARVDRYLFTLERLLAPDLIVVGGGVSEEAEKWVGLLHTRAPIERAQLGNNAGIVGAALAGAEGRAPA